MDSISLRQLISVPLYSRPIRNFAQRSFCLRYIGPQFRHFTLVLHSKRSQFQDFQSYAKPSRLLPASEVKVWTDISVEKYITSLKEGVSDSLYKIKIQTSSLYGSGLTDINAGILICLVDENGESILQMIPSISSIDHNNMSSEDKAISDVLHFQRGCTDEFVFVGPKLGKIEAVWVSPVSGQWRVRGVTLSVTSQSQQLEETSEGLYDNLKYDFPNDDILLGDQSEVSMVELRPSQVTKLCGNPFEIIESLSQSSSWGNSNISNEESMKEYADLKLSLLFYDALIIAAGSAIASFSAGEKGAFAFLAGGMSGFFYLLLLQRSVDELPSPASSVSVNETGILDKIFGKYKGQAIGLVLAVAFAVITVKFVSEENKGLSVTPKDVLLAMTGFLACKVAVVLAAFRPIPVSEKVSK